jgi:hypothetical protein
MPLNRGEQLHSARRKRSYRIDILPPTVAGDSAVQASLSVPTPAGLAALDAAQRFARSASAQATLRAYKADWTHFAGWCDAHGFVAIPAAPAPTSAAWPTST